MKKDMVLLAVLLIILLCFSFAIVFVSDSYPGKQSDEAVSETASFVQATDETEELVNNMAVVTTNSKKSEIPVINGAIPVIDVFKASGVLLKWEDNNHVSFSIGEKQYVIDISNVTIHEKNDSFNYILIPPGTSAGFAYSSIDNIYVDLDTMNGILFMVGLDAYVSIVK